MSTGTNNRALTLADSNFSYWRLIGLEVTSSSTDDVENHLIGHQQYLGFQSNSAQRCYDAIPNY
jgi:hypothetical protein